MKFPRLMVFFWGRGPCFGGRRTVANSGTPCVRERTAAHIGLAIPGYVQLGVRQLITCDSLLRVSAHVDTDRLVSHWCRSAPEGRGANKLPPTTLPA